MGTYQDTLATVLLPAKELSPRAVVHQEPPTLLTATPVCVGLMVLLSVQIISVDQLQLLPPPPLQLLQLPQQRQQQPQHPPPHPHAPQSQALLLAQTVSSLSPSRGPPTSPAQSGSTGGRTRAASGAPPRLIARVFMLMGRVTMASVGLTVILTQCLWQIFLRVLLGPKLGQLVRRTRIL